LLILAINTAAAACSLALMRDNKLLAERHETMARGQDARLLPLILEMLETAAVNFAQLDRIAVTRGPGSFTGIRIGLAAARGIGLAAKKPVIGINRLLLYQQTLLPQTQTLALPLMIILDSKRDELFCQWSEPDGKPQALPFMALPDTILEQIALRPCCVAGDMLELLNKIQQKNPALHFVQLPMREAAAAGLIAASANITDQNFVARPLYLRAPDVSSGPTPMLEANA
jgi:tRNA threonylcarbamoyladenosine biosynthesis protein TsaB